MVSIESYISRCVSEGAFPGAAWAVGGKEKILEQGFRGVLGGNLGPVGPDTIYDIASLTKIFVTLGLMRQFEEGLFRLEDTLGFFLPYFSGNPKGDITIRELLTHTSALHDLPRLYRLAPNREELLEAISLSPLRRDSGTRVEYTCEGFILLGEIMAAIDGAPLDTIIRERVLWPLGMRDTCYRPPPSLLERIAPTEDSKSRGLIRGEVHDGKAWAMGGVSGNAGLFSTAADLAKLASRVLAKGWEADGWGEGGAFLRPATIRMTVKNYSPGMGANRGLGWLLAGKGGPGGDLMTEGSFGHTGFTGTSIWIDPEQGLYGVLLSNRIHPDRNNGKIFRCRQIFHNLMILNYGK
ncbi:MAG: beta-lactamase family protein [Treponema sp.]|jgi:CubicO group peptidase (beta-lactamase class C family)|nr:beta-lactamase family protein [Treponema sp.]